ncbi:sn-glycerol-3-phosphate import ATP-binding protein UgpC [Pseudovibrio japonicus]|uniref:Sn-glycerol-3-phosphate import ATP-binding protein UgpC n=1 Tax=Pseudovibrio japonicus TaxID=366534 RepID=A0ABQ3EFV8_9HYPH|nr:sn-glycerol-3-phosphate import ATP-binding protein UgpC [Pseudovibrio japonicus]GHB35167.1 sn-glycerol-3-phosphate import ATP-binding protein UgpC [Pseudovibrio japonicus]
MATVTLQGVKKSFGSTEVIHGIDVEIADGEFIVIVGPSGCGKSTLLRMVAGLETVSAGDVLIGGIRANDKEPMDRDIAMVFQNYALYPHMSVRQNMGYGLKIAKLPKAEINAKVEEAARLLQLEPLLDRKPRQLSGGQRQRVAMGRAIVREPAVFLFDEPLSNLDAKLRVQMRLEIRELQAKLGITSLYVTHDQVEAMTMADRMIVMNGGVAEQIGSPLEVYETPRTLFAAQFIGSPAMNIIDAQIENGKVMIDGTAIENSAHANGPVKFGVRPEHMTPDENGPLRVNVLMTEPLGANTLLHGKLQGHPDTFTVSLPGVHSLLETNKTMSFSVQPGQSHVFDANTGLRIPAEMPEDADSEFIL